MNIAYYHASKFGNGALVAEEFKKIMAARGITVTVQHVRDANPKGLPKADLYVFSSPGRFGKPKGNARRFLRKVSLEWGTSSAPGYGPETSSSVAPQRMSRGRTQAA